MISKADGKRKTGYNWIKLSERSMGQVIVDEKGIKDSCKKYAEKLMNEENQWYHTISSGVKEGRADRNRIDEVAAALKKVKRRKGPGLSGLVTEMILAISDTGTRWILDLRNGIVKEGCR